MPFLTDDGRPLDELLLAERPADGYRFELRAPIAYLDPVSGRRYRVPAREAASGTHGITDLASVPTPLWGFIASYGRQSAPAVLHDEQSIAAAELGDRGAALAQRREDDRVFRTALREQRVPLLRAWLMWAWVSADRERAYGGALGWLLVVQAMVGALVVLAASVAAFWNPAWLALALMPALAALPWTKLAPLQLVLTFSLAIVGPLFLVHVVALVPLRVLEAIVELVSGGDPAGVLRPTVRPPGGG